MSLVQRPKFWLNRIFKRKEHSRKPTILDKQNTNFTPLKDGGGLITLTAFNQATKTREFILSMRIRNDCSILFEGHIPNTKITI